MTEYYVLRETTEVRYDILSNHVKMLGSKGLLPPTDANEKFRFELLRSKLLPQFCKHSESVDLLHKSLLPHVWRVPSSKALSCKHERLFDLLTLASCQLSKKRVFSFAA